MLEIDNTHGNKNPNSASQKWLADEKAVPSELNLIYVYESNGYLYTKIDGATRSIAGMVYRHHHPEEQIAFGKPVYHIDHNKQNNEISNLSLIRGD